jgi:VCBS repeat-containing protein/ELWxxDGT repeat protein
MMTTAVPLRSSGFFNPALYSPELILLNVNGVGNSSVMAQGKIASCCELLVVFDARVSDLPKLLGAVVEGAGCYVLSEDEDAVVAITELLAQTGAQRLALVAHGESGVVHLGAYPLNEAQIQRQSRLLQEWGVEEIALYSCEVAKGDRGLSFIYQLSELTASAVAATANQVGCRALGGHWHLETTTAAINCPQVFALEGLQGYEATLVGPVQYNLNLGTADSNPSNLTNINGTLYFIATNGSNGRELWKIDPATGNSLRVTDIEFGSGSSFASNLTNVNSTLYFSASNSSNGTELWKIDPTTGNPVLLEIQPGIGSSNPFSLIDVNGTLYFIATNGSNGTELWKIDPTTGNPVLLEIQPGSGSSNPFSLIDVNGTLYFSASNSTNGRELWRIDPITGNPVLLEIESGSGSSFPSNLSNINGTLYFSAFNISNGTELWKIDPVTGNPVRVTDIQPDSGSSDPSNLIDVNGTLYFSASNSITGRELWKIDPTTGNPARVTDIESGSGSSNPFSLININGTLYFSASNSSNGLELWKIDPTTGLPALLEIQTGNGSSSPSNLTNINGTLYFTANNSSNGNELWKIDSTTGLPVLLEIESGSGSSFPSNLSNINGTLYFSANNSSNGIELWKIDPITGSPVRVTDIEPGSSSSNPSNLTNVNGTLYFSAANSSNGRELWKLDPAAGSPVLTADINNTQDVSSNPSAMTTVNGTLYFSATNSSNGRELWKIDPVTGVPVLLDIEPDFGSSNPSNLTNINGTLYFIAANSTNGRELWKINPTTGNPVRVTDIEFGNGSSNPSNLTTVNGTLYFTANNSINGTELWKIDPATGLPVLLEIESGSVSSAPSNLTNINGTLYFSAANIINGRELWKIDPATGLPVLLEIQPGSGSSNPLELTNINSTLYFIAANGSNGRELWKIDSTTGNPARVTDIEFGSGSSNPSNLTNVNGTLYFIAANGSNGRELWKIDPATGNSVRVTDIELGSGSSFPSNLINVNGTLYFTAFNSSNGTELWKIDPTTGLPALLEIQPGNGSSNPSNLTNVNGTLYFTATNGSNGTELWKIDPTTGLPALLEIQPGSDSSGPSNLINVNGTLYFSAFNSSNGTELWKIDSTTENPVLVQDFNPGSGSSNPNILGYENRKLYVSANNGTNGSELWGIDINTPPTGSATAILSAGAEDANYIITAVSLLQGFSDLDNDTISVSNLTATNGTLVNNGNSTWTFTPTANYNGTVNLSYTVVDGSGGSISATQTFNLTAVNDAPTGTATAILATGTEDTAYTISTTDLLAGFSDIDGDTLSVSDLMGANGTLVNNNDSTYTFTPTTDYNGTVNLSYSVVDEKGGSIAATQSFNLAAVNDAPVAVAAVNGVTEDSTVTGSVSGTDVDTGETATLSYSLVNPAPTGLIFNSNGTYTFDASSYDSLPEGVTQDITIPFTTIDVNGATSAPANLVITITGTNDVPVAVASSKMILKDTTITGSVTATDADTGTLLTYSLVNAAPTGLSFNSDGTYTFDASSYASLAAGQTQVLSIDFTATDGIDTSTPEALTITITGSNDTPVAIASSNAVLEDATITGSVSATDADTGTVLTYALVNTAPTGLTFNSNGTYTFDASSYDSLAAGQTQILDIAFTATDGIATSTAENLTITITGTNDTPVAIASSNAVLEDATITGFVSATDDDTGAVLIYALVNATPIGLIFNSDGTYTFDASSYDSLAAGQTQVLSIDFTATDGIATSTPENLALTLTGTNDAAIITGTSTGSVLESGTSTSGTPTATGDLNATDVDNTSDIWTAVATATATGYGTYTLITDGIWNYTLNNTNSTVQALNTGDTLTDTFAVQTIDGTTQTVSITINGTNDVPIITSFSDDTGVSNTDRITKDNTLTLTGTAEANSTIELFNGLTALGTATANNLGTWNLTTATLTDGTYNLTALATDAAGNTSASSAPLSVTVDTIAAAAPTLSLAIDSGSSSTDKITNSGIVNVGGLEPGASWEYSTNNGTTWTTGTSNNFTLSVDGIKTAVVRQTDPAGNTSSSSAPFTFTLDTTPPAKTGTVNAMTLDSGTSPTDFLTNNGNAGRIYNGTLSAALSVGESLQVSVDDGTTWANATVSGTNWSFTDNTPKGSNWTIQTRVVDASGNGTIRSKTVTLDQQISAASAVTLDLAAASDTGVSATDNLTTTVRPTFSVTFDSTKALVGDTLEIRHGATILGSATLTATQVSAGNANITLATNLTNGINTLSALHRDAAGNSVTGSSPLAVTLDRQISAASAVTLDLLASSDSGSSTTDNLTNLALSNFAVAFDATKAQTGDIVEVRKGNTVLGSTILSAAQISAGIANVALTTALTNGSNTLTAVHRDAAGNSIIGSSTLAVNLDTTAPIAANIIGYTATSVVGTTEPNGMVLLSTSASAPTAFASTATAVASGSYTINTSTLAGSSAGTTYYLYAQDVAGNVSSLNSGQKVIVGTAGADNLINVGSTGGDLLVGGLGTDAVQYAVASNAIALTGQITGANITSGSVNIRTANIDVLTGLETLQFAGSGYSGVGTGANQLKSGVQTALSNNSIAAFIGAYDSATGIFTLGASPSNNATLVTIDSNAGNATNYETFLLLDKTSIAGSLTVGGGTVTLGL